MLIRPARRSDLAALTQIYNHYVATSHCTFDTAPFTEMGREDWWRKFDGARYQCLLAEADGTLTGYACSSPLKEKAAYQTSVEVSVYVAPERTGQGIGPLLYRGLIEALSRQDLHRAYALVAQPNDPSMALHESFGFKPVSRLTQVGRKFDRYWDVVWLELAL